MGFVSGALFGFGVRRYDADMGIAIIAGSLGLGFLMAYLQEREEPPLRRVRFGVQGVALTASLVWIAWMILPAEVWTTGWPRLP